MPADIDPISPPPLPSRCSFLRLETLRQPINYANGSNRKILYLGEGRNSVASPKRSGLLTSYKQ